MPVNDLIQLRKGSASLWSNQDPVLASGEPGYDITNNILKIGDGINIWSSLSPIITSDIQIYVKNTTNASVNKGQVVYINGAQGSNPTIELSIASGESSSSKTIGLLKQNLGINEFGYVITEGILEGLDTNSAIAAGDPMWLSPSVSGGVVYGTVNKPSAPNHMVFLGYVLRKQSNNGKVYVKIQNGFELGELHNVATNGFENNGKFLQYNSLSGLWIGSNTGNFTKLQLNNIDVSVSGHSHLSSAISDFNEAVDDRVSSLLVAGTGINIGYNDGSNTLTINLASSAITGFEILTAPKNTFTVSQGYLSNNLNVYYNGFRLLNSEDYVATDGSTFTLYGTTASGDVIEWEGITSLGQYSPIGHTHSSSEITNFNTSVSGLLPVTSISGGNNISISTNGTIYTISVSGQLGLTSEEVDDRVAGLLVGGTGIYLNYNDSNNTLTIASTGNYANSYHTHSSSDIIDFNSSVNGLVSGVYALINGKLNQFASTSSAEFSSTINDETGSGLLVFNNSPTFTGIPIVPTASSGTNTNQIASTAFVRTEISNLVASAPSTLDTLNELATALGNDANFSTTVTNSLAGKANLSGAVFTGSISSPSGNFTQNLQVNGTGVSISGHIHIASDIGDSTVAGRALLTATDASSQRTSLGLGSLATQNGTFSGTSSGTNTGDQTISIVGDVTAAGSTGVLTATVTKINGVALSGLSTGLLKNTTGTGAPSIAIAGTDYAAASHTHTVSNITDFNSSVSGLLPVKNLIAGTGIIISSSSDVFTINSTSSSSSSNNIIEYTATSGFPSSGVSQTIYLASDSSRIYRWTGSQYIEIGPIGSPLLWANPPASATSSGTIGDLAYNANYLYICTSGNTWKRASLSDSVSIEYIVVGGGGGGGSTRGAGGGAGGYLYGFGLATAGSSVSVTVGSGGAGGTGGSLILSRGAKGGDSILALPAGNITAIGGGYGAGGLSSLFYGSADNGGTGGSGGGGSGYTPAGSGGSATSGQGSSGGAGLASGEPYNGGGGGGATTSGGSATSPANGGDGSSAQTSILSVVSAGVDIGGTRWIAGGGGAGTYNATPGSGGKGGGASGGNTNVNGSDATANTGGGGGGGGNAASGGSGGSGVVIIRYTDNFAAATTTGSPTVINTGGYRYYMFTNNGSFTIPW